MRSKVGRGLVWGAISVAILIGATGSAVAANCALYARAETGVYLYGAAGGWWDEAQGRYQRGQAPAAGAILVFKRTGHTPSGHVAVVARIVGPREILIDHANWYRGTVTRGMPAIDTSPNNDWTSVAVLDLRSGQYGRNSPTYGFVYPGTGPQEIVATRDASGLDSYVADSQPPSRWRPQARLFHVALVTDDRHHNGRRTTAAHGSHRRGAPTHQVHAVANQRLHHHPAAGGHTPARTVKTKIAEAKQHRA